MLDKEKECFWDRLDVWLKEELLEIKKNRISAKEQGFEKVKQDFYRETVGLKKKSEQVGLSLDRGIRFAAENPAAGQEAAMFLTRISEDKSIMAFIREYGCDAYLEKGEIFLRTRREEELKKEIRELYEKRE